MMGLCVRDNYRYMEWLSEREGGLKCIFDKDRHVMDLLLATLPRAEGGGLTEGRQVGWGSVEAIGKCMGVQSATTVDPATTRREVLKKILNIQKPLFSIESTMLRQGKTYMRGGTSCNHMVGLEINFAERTVCSMDSCESDNTPFLRHVVGALNTMMTDILRGTDDFDFENIREFSAISRSWRVIQKCGSNSCFLVSLFTGICLALGITGTTLADQRQGRGSDSPEDAEFRRHVSAVVYPDSIPEDSRQPDPNADIVSRWLPHCWLPSRPGLQVILVIIVHVHIKTRILCIYIYTHTYIYIYI